MDGPGGWVCAFTETGFHTPQTGSQSTHARSPSGHNSSGPVHSQGPFGPFSLAGGRAGLRTRPTVSHMRGSTHPLFKAGDLLTNSLSIIHDRSLGQHLRVVHVENHFTEQQLSQNNSFHTPQTGSHRAQARSPEGTTVRDQHSLRGPAVPISTLTPIKFRA